MALKIAITGGIGSGKSLVCSIFQQMGVPIYKADERAHSLMQKAEVREQIIELFGGNVYTNGQFDRKKIAYVVFGDEDKLRQLNDIIHPAVKSDYLEWHEEQTAAYTLMEAAIVFEINIQERYDKVILVSAPEECRLARVMKRDKSSPLEVKKRMERQWPDERKRTLADFEIVNDGEEMLVPQCLKIHRILLQLSAQHEDE